VYGDLYHVANMCFFLLMPVSLRHLADSRAFSDIPCEVVLIPMNKAQSFEEDLKYVHEQSVGSKKSGFFGALGMRSLLGIALRKPFRNLFVKSDAY
jgi:hypothetical protein